jgi:hypothetical protein
VEVREAALDDQRSRPRPKPLAIPRRAITGVIPGAPQEPAVLVEVIATVSENAIGSLARPAALAGDRP